ncbi:glycosyl transferase [Acidithiobacillus ferridurans]|uniref:glycosyltransferase n=1 Tax=Acidithiobacillus ferridurans TaxID=1232575 RepID=UPI000DE26666|nr:glycosyltransferase [Acidithiobacillus ferridurans]RBM02291.1 glycosyl transferase [Acidithiobacillus ferridurans]
MKIAKTVTVVTVTYGQREQLLRQVLDSVRGMDISKIVVVDNGSQWPVGAELTAAYGDLVDVVEMGANTGSAKGFATGIQRALDLGAEYIWLLDDDNCPRSDALQKLLKVYTAELANTLPDRLAVLAFRLEHQADLARGVPMHRINLKVNSFRGFNVLDIPYKVWRRTHWGRPQLSGQIPEVIGVDLAVYGGLLFHRKLIQAIGLPNGEFILYGDDIEFTNRIKKVSGQILLVTSAVIDDLESTWNVKDNFSNSFVCNLEGGADIRAYYSMRNLSYFDSTELLNNKFIFMINLKCYILILYVYAISLRRKERFNLLFRAIKDGLSGQLGQNEKFPL